MKSSNNILVTFQGENVQILGIEVRVDRDWNYCWIGLTYRYTLGVPYTTTSQDVFFSEFASNYFETMLLHGAFVMHKGSV